jgi:hypothetical protein
MRLAQKWMVTGMVVSLLSLTGCGIIPASVFESKNKKQNQQQATPVQTTPSDTKTDSSTSPMNPEEPNLSSNEEIAFETHNFDKSYSPPPLSDGGVWVYQDQTHAPQNIAPLFHWNEVDVLHVQITDKKYLGHTLKPIRLQWVNERTIRIVSQLVPTDLKESTPPYCYIKVKKGILRPDFTYILETETGERLLTMNNSN